MSMSQVPKQIKLILSVKAQKWRAEDPDAHESDQGFQSMRPKVLKRDSGTCRACGFKAEAWQEVHHLNDDHSDNSEENLVTLCSFCHMTQHIGLVGIQKEGVLIWLPEISQTSLHHMVRAILVAEHEAAKPTSAQNPEIRQIAASAKMLRDRFLSRENDAKEHIGTSSPEVLGNILWTLSNISGEKFYPRRELMLNGIRLLPLGVRTKDNRNIMQEMVKGWVGDKGVYARTLAVKEWKKLLAGKVGGG